MTVDQYHSIAEKVAQNWGVAREIHENDLIFEFLINNAVFDSKEAAVHYYFDDGANSAHKFIELVRDVCELERNSYSVLEFASGYGCVTRHLQKKIPKDSLTACDIHPQAIKFIQDHLAVRATLSTSTPEAFSSPRIYDVVFALSFFSHMPKHSFGRWLRQLGRVTRPGGFLIFTTHGLLSVQLLQNVQFDMDGFYFFQFSEQNDLDSNDYGTTVTKPSFVLNELFKNQNFQLNYFREGFWWNHQDLFVVKVIA